MLVFNYLKNMKQYLDELSFTYRKVENFYEKIDCAYKLKKCYRLPGISSHIVLFVQA